MAWVPISAWLVAVVVALVVLGFCAYEIVWKTRRLRADLQRLRVTGERLAELQAGLQDVSARALERISSAGSR